MQINEFVKLGGDQLVPYYADILRAILPCISDKEEKIRVVARETNDELLAIRANPAEVFYIGAILSMARRCSFCHLEKHLGTNLVSGRPLALRHCTGLQPYPLSQTPF
ncbi:hypothetical protein NE237_021811 [Protea cynaroides]|uniref:Uncharacterized protein n=1 Tax=Protea cynaroides TaxID=273540 RepID=A0A9Q0HAX9_9MAGN|nr:hypothetical protein NE237_021811 [Protea cynaroides]